MEDTIQNLTTTKEVKQLFDSTLKNINVDEFNKSSVLFYTTHAYIIETRRTSTEAFTSKTSSPQSFLSKLKRNSLNKNEKNKRGGRDDNDDVVKKNAIEKSKANRDKRIKQLNTKLEKLNKNIQLVENKLNVMNRNKYAIELKLHEALVNDQNISVLEED